MTWNPSERPDATLREGELTVIGRIRSASNATYLCEVSGQAEDSVHCVYKPVRGERPLWDFPDGTLAGREVAAYLISAELGWNVVPYTVFRDGPAGVGMVQRWIHEPELAEGALDLVDICLPEAVPTGYLPILRALDADGAEIVLVHADDNLLRRMAVFDTLVNNADRKGGHILRGADGGVYGVDHGISLHAEDKLRTVLWGWAGKPVEPDLLADVVRLEEALRGDLGDALTAHITTDEVVALRQRAAITLDEPVMPMPDRNRPIPWPAF
ncbi:SCO1664 family protein [Mycobacterium sp. CBMA271]|uniref:SCO1664 family protein n=1 Tax=unclassified Mycobacteroides TaxID=2618759 RepID=UPI0012DCCDE2|nr:MULTISPECIES: SCO1664 family protein [unclassified Mycobacteroides]MUM18687.1 phosphatidylinositol kinase [Mycobacteroides sp. CBMA 326]MUM22649.1 SCO1664 family protein [Mycobacteroides sp. CBMA 271]